MEKWLVVFGMHHNIRSAADQSLHIPPAARTMTLYDTPLEYCESIITGIFQITTFSQGNVQSLCIRGDFRCQYCLRSSLDNLLKTFWLATICPWLVLSLTTSADLLPTMVCSKFCMAPEDLCIKSQSANYSGLHGNRNHMNFPTSAEYCIFPLRQAFACHVTILSMLGRLDASMLGSVHVAKVYIRRDMTCGEVFIEASFPFTDL